MAQPAQVKFTLPSGEWIAIDNGAPGVTSTNGAPYTAGSGGPPTGGGSGNWSGSGAVSGGFDLTANGATAQGTNPFADTGSVLLDSVNDTVYVDPMVATVKGNPVSNTQPSYATVTTVLNSAQSTRLLWKNPA